MSQTQTQTQTSRRPIAQSVNTSPPDVALSVALQTTGQWAKSAVLRGPGDPAPQASYSFPALRPSRRACPRAASKATAS